MMEIRTRGKGTVDRGLQGSVGTLDDMNPTRLSKRSQAVPLHKSTMNCLIIWVPCNKAHRIRNIVLNDICFHNLDAPP